MSLRIFMWAWLWEEASSECTVGCHVAILWRHQLPPSPQTNFPDLSSSPIYSSTTSPIYLHRLPPFFSSIVIAIVDKLDPLRLYIHRVHKDSFFFAIRSFILSVQVRFDFGFCFLNFKRKFERKTGWIDFGKEMESMTLTGLLKKTALDFPERRAISVSGKFDLTHAQLDELIDHAASQLVAAGVSPGDVVALTFPNTVEVCALRLSCALTFVQTISFSVSGCVVGEEHWYPFGILYEAFGRCIAVRVMLHFCYYDLVWFDSIVMAGEGLHKPFVRWLGRELPFVCWIFFIIKLITSATMDWLLNS